MATQPPNEFDVPLTGTAVWGGPEAIGEMPFDRVPAASALDVDGEDPPRRPAAHARACSPPG